MLIRSVALGVAVGALALAACGDDDGGAVCGAGTVDVDGECVPAGGPDAGVDDGPGCGAGTRPDADGDCVASTLPSDQRSCLGRFGPIAEDAADTVFVDAAFAGASDGSAAAPFSDLQSAVSAAADGDAIAIASGTYAGGIDLLSPVAIEGRCAREVTIDGTLIVASAGISIAGVTITGGEPAGVAVHAAPGSLDDPGLRIVHSIVEMNAGAGVAVDSSAVAIDASEIRLTQALPDSDDLAAIGSGVYAFFGSSVRLTNSIVEMNAGVGVDIADALGGPDTPGSAFAETPQSAGIVEMNIVEMNGLAGIRVGVTEGELAPATAPLVTIASNIVEMNGLIGIEARGRRIHIVDNAIADNGGAAEQDPFGVALTDCRMTVTGNELSGTAGGGVFAQFSTGVIAANRVSGFDAVGIALSECQDASATNNTVLDVGNVGILAFEAQGTTIAIDGNEIAGVRATAADVLASGHGIYVAQFQAFRDDNFYAVRGNHVHDCEGMGISIDGVDPIDGAVPLYAVEMNVVERNQFAGINVQFSGDGDVFGNAVADNTGFGIRGVVAADGAARVRVNANQVEGTTASSIGKDVDGDGIAMIDSHVGIGTILPGGTILANVVIGNARAGIFATGDTDGFCDGNEVGIDVANGVYDILIQGPVATGGLATTGNNTALGVTSSVAELEAEHGLTSSAEPFDKPF